MKERIFIFGASGHAKVIIDIVERENRYSIAFLADDDGLLKGMNIYGYKVIGGKRDLMDRKDVVRGIVAIGSNVARAKVADWLMSNGFGLVSAVHPSAQLARGVEVGKGSVIMGGAVINSDTRIGENVIVNSRVSVDHDCLVDDGVHIAPGVTLCGTVRVGQGSFIGAGATIIPNRTIGANVIVGAGAVVARDLPDRVLAVGVPAKIIKELPIG